VSITTNYFKSDVLFADNNQKAPMSGAAAFIEIQAPGGITFATALKIGQQTTFTDRLWKGYFYDAFGYNSTLNDAGRQRAREYFAMRYQVWPKNAAALDVFPFAANKTRSLDLDIENFVSTPYSGPKKDLTRGDFIGNYELQYLLREQMEFNAAQRFFEQHRPVVPFVLRDYRFVPYKEIPVDFTSSLREQGSDVTYRFNYTFSVESRGSSVDAVSSDSRMPCIPTGLTLTVLSDSSIRVEWDETTDDCSGSGGGSDSIEDGGLIT
jgi:hypothetical protein